MQFKGAKRIAVVVIIFVLVGAMLLSTASFLFYASADDSLSSARAKYNSLEKKAAELQAQIKENQSDVQDKQAQSTALEQQISTIEEQVVLLNSDVVQLESDISDLNDSIAAKQDEITQNTDTFKYRLRAMYMTGGLSDLEIMMGSDSFADYLTRAQMLQSVSKHDQELISSLKADLSSIQEEKASVEAKKATIEENRTALKSKYSQLESARSQNEKLISELKSNTTDLQSSAQKYQDAMDDQQAQISKILAAEEAKRLAALQSSQESGTADSGTVSNQGYMWPLPGYTMITSPFGYRTHPIYGVSRLHTGIDISGGNVYGKPIVASRDGTVITATSHYSYGNYIIISHGDGYSTLYAHCSQLCVSEGQTVKQGQVIAYVGNSGDSTGAHLHFEVRQGTTPVNPLSYVSR